MRRHVIAIITLAAPVAAQAPAPTTIAAATASLDKRDGYFPIYWDSTKGRVLLEIPAGRLSQDFLLLPSLATGIVPRSRPRPVPASPMPVASDGSNRKSWLSRPAGISKSTRPLVESQ